MGVMNNILLTTTTLLFLILSLTPTRATAKPVLDSDGNPLVAGAEYYIQPAGIGFRGGITRSPRPDQSRCPLYAVESPSEVDLGHPVKFLQQVRSLQILVSTKLQIDSGFSAYCRDDGIWRLKFDAWSRRPIVIASGDHNIPRTWFTIEESKTDVGQAYKIASENGYLSVSSDIAGLKVLGVSSNNPQNVLNVKFVKKTEDQQDVAWSM